MSGFLIADRFRNENRSAIFPERFLIGIAIAVTIRKSLIDFKSMKNGNQQVVTRTVKTALPFNPTCCTLDFPEVGHGLLPVIVFTAPGEMLRLAAVQSARIRLTLINGRRELENIFFGKVRLETTGNGPAQSQLTSVKRSIRAVLINLIIVLSPSTFRFSIRDEF